MNNIPVSVGDTVMLELANNTGPDDYNPTINFVGVNMTITAEDFRITSTPSTITEQTGVATISVERLQQLDMPATVSYGVIGGTATPGVDFVLPNGVMEYAAGVSNLTIPLTILDDALVEGTETILLSLTNSASGSVMKVPLTIRDDDKPLLAKPFNLTLLGQVTNVSGSDIQVVGTYAYVCDFEGQTLTVIDVSNPTNPRRIGGCAIKSDIDWDWWGWIDGVRRFAVSSNYAYVPGGRAGLQVIDISDSSQPEVKGVYAGGTSSNQIGAVTFVQSNAYVSVQNPDGTAEIDIVDVSNPAQPVKISTLTVPYLYPWTAFEVSGNRLYGWLEYDTGSHGLVIIDASDPRHSEIVGQYPLYGGIPGRITANRDFLYTAQTGDMGWMWAVHLFDLRDPARPVQLRRFGYNDLGDNVAFDLQLSGNYLYVNIFEDTSTSELVVFDVRDPMQPVRVAAVPIGGFYPIRVVGNHVYALSSEFDIFELTEPPAFIRLSVMADRHLSLSWNDVAKGMKLQHATRLTNPDWQDVPGSEATSSITLPIESGPGFFRLVKP